MKVSRKNMLDIFFKLIFCKKQEQQQYQQLKEELMDMDGEK